MVQYYSINPALANGFKAFYNSLYDWHYLFWKRLSDLGASINLMPFSIFQKKNLENLSQQMSPFT